MPAPLENFLRSYAGGYSGTMPQEMYDYFGGDDLVKQLQKYDPSARVEDAQMGGGEGGGNGVGKRLVYDTFKMPGGLSDMQPQDLHPNVKAGAGPAHYDENYGWVRKGSDFADDKDPAWVKIAPLVVAGLATGGAALGAAPAMAGVAGGTAGVTGAAAGLGAGNIAMGGAGSLLTQIAQKAPQLFRQIEQSGGNFNMTSLLPLLAQYAGGQAGIPNYATSGATTLAQMTQRKR